MYIAIKSNFIEGYLIKMMSPSSRRTLVPSSPQMQPLLRVYLFLQGFLLILTWCIFLLFLKSKWEYAIAIIFHFYTERYLILFHGDIVFLLQAIHNLCKQSLLNGGIGCS